MERPPGNPTLTERQARRLEAQFSTLYYAFLERKFKHALRLEIDHIDAVNLVRKRFSKAIRKEDSEVVKFVHQHGLAALKEHPYFRSWIKWTITDKVRQFYREKPDLVSDGETDEDDHPPKKGQYISLETVAEQVDYEPEIEERIDEARAPSHSFLERVSAALVEAAHITERDAEIFLDRMAGHKLRVIGEQHDLGTSQVDRIAKRIFKLLQRPDIQILVRKVLAPSRDAD